MSSRKKKPQKRNPSAGTKKDTQASKNGAEPNKWPVPNPMKDDLQAIKGIGLSIERALNGAGIYRYRDFLNKSEEQISELLLSTQNVCISPGEIEKNGWLDQARHLADETREKAGETDEDNPAPAQKKDVAAQAEKTESRPVAGSETGMQENAAEQSSQEKPSESEEVPTSSVSVADASDREQQAEPGTDYETVKQRPRQSDAESPVIVDPADTVADEKKATTPSHEINVVAQAEEQGVHIDKVSFTQKGSNGKTVLHGEIELSFQGRSKPADIDMCHVQILAHDRGRDKYQVLACDSCRLADEMHLSLPCDKPGVGDYGLRVVAFPMVDNAAIALHRGPSLRIVP